MIFLSAGITQSMLAAPHPHLGFMANPGNNQAALGALPWLHWAADNGRFARPDTWDAGEWLEWLAGLRRWRKTCLFAVAPDTVGDARATLELSVPYLPTLHQLGFPAAFVTQDGATSALIPWDGLEVLMVGGSTEWKLSEASWALCAEAKRRGKWVHVGRVNSLSRLRACRASLVDSADGRTIAMFPDRDLPRVWDWLDAVNGQTALEDAS